MIDGAQLHRRAAGCPRRPERRSSAATPPTPTMSIGTFPASAAADVRAAVDALDKAAPRVGGRRARAARRDPGIRGRTAGIALGEADRRARPRGRQDHRRGDDGGQPDTGEPAVLRRRGDPHHRSDVPGRRVRNWCITLREPVGIVGAITPWNFPLNIPSRKLGPALAAGNPVLFKPSEITPLMGQRSSRRCWPGGCRRVRSPWCKATARPAAAVAADRAVDAVTFTGSTHVGRLIHAPGGPSPPRSSSRWAARTPSWSPETPTSTARPH